MEKTYSSPDFGVTVQKGAGEVIDITDYVDSFNEISREALIEDTTGFGKTAREFKASKVTAAAAITIEGFLTLGDGETAADVLNDIGATIKVVAKWGGPYTDSFDAIIQTFVKRPIKDQLSRFSCNIQPTGEITQSSEPFNYTVTWIVDGVETTETYAYGAAITAPEDPIKEGYTFTGWEPAVPATMPAEDLTITAQFEIDDGL